MVAGLNYNWCMTEAQANLADAQAQRARFCNADLTMANLEAVRFNGADFSGAALPATHSKHSRAQLDSAALTH